MHVFRVVYQGEVIAESECDFCDFSKGVLHGRCTVTPAYDMVRAYFQARPHGIVDDPAHMVQLHRYHEEIKAPRLEAIRSDGVKIQSVGIDIQSVSAILPTDETVYYLFLEGCNQEIVQDWLAEHPLAIHSWIMQLRKSDPEAVERWIVDHPEAYLMWINPDSKSDQELVQHLLDEQPDLKRLWNEPQGKSDQEES